MGALDILGMTPAQADAVQKKKRLLSVAGIQPAAAPVASADPAVTQLAPIVPAKIDQPIGAKIGEDMNRLVGTASNSLVTGTKDAAGLVGDVAAAGIKPFVEAGSAYFGSGDPSTTAAAPAVTPARLAVVPARPPVSQSALADPTAGIGDTSALNNVAPAVQPGITPVAAGPGAIRKVVGPDGRVTYTDQGTEGTVLTRANARGGFISPSGPATPPVNWAAQSAAMDQRLADQARNIGGINMPWKRTDAEIAQNAKNDALIALSGDSPKKGANAAAYLRTLEEGNTAQLNNAATINARMAEHLIPSGTAVAGIQANAPHVAAQTALAKQQAESAAQVEEDRKAAADIRKQMIAETDPAKYKALERKLYAIQGKAQPKYQIVTEKGVAADGITPTQTSHIVSEDTTGNPIATPLVGPGVGASAPVVVNGYRFPNQAAADRYKKDAGVK